MKKRMMLLASVSVLALVLSGCASSSREQELEQKVEQLEQQIAQLQPATDTTADANGSADAADSNTAAPDNSTDPTADTAAQDDTSNDFDTLSSKVSDAVAKADAAQPSGTIDENRSLFFTHKTTLDALDRELDAYEDALEAQYRGGTLDYTDFRKQDREIEKLEDALDDAEDRLEDRFGIDD